MSDLAHFLLGATEMGGALAGLFFLRFWRMTSDRLFVALAATFWLLSIDWTLQSRLGPTSHSGHWIYLLRLLAFSVLIAGIIDKNRRRGEH